MTLVDSCTNTDLATGGRERDLTAAEVLLGQYRSTTTSSPIICRNQGYCILFRTSSTYAGTAVGGISGADTKCNSDGNKPANTGTYKAFITDGAARVACTTANCSGGPSEHVDWALYANTQYRQVNQVTTVFTTDANGIFVFGVASAGLDGTASSFHTGFNSNWTVSGGNNCTAWTVGGGSGMQGVGNSTGSTMLQNASIGCASVVSLACAQQ